MTILLVLLALQSGDKAKAATFHKEGEAFFKDAKYEKALEAFESALKELKNEDPNLSYRGPGVTVRVAYHPYYFAGRCAQFLADAAATPAEKKRRLDLAISHLGRSIHPEAKARVDAARDALAKIDLADPIPAPRPAPATPSPEAIRAKGELDAFLSSGKLEEALEAMRRSSYWKGREDERKAQEVRIREEQAKAIGQKETKLASGIERLAGEEALKDPEEHLARLKEARVPKEVSKEPPAAFRWLEGFVEQLEKQKEAIGKMAGLDEAVVVGTSDSFEALAKSALEQGYFPGFRAARNIAHALRMSRMKALPGAALPAEEKWARALQLEAAAKKSEEALAGTTLKDEAMAGELKRYVGETVKAQATVLTAVRATLPSPDLKNRVVRAEESLRDPEAAADATRLRAVAANVAELQGDARFGALQPAEQARAIVASAVALATAAFLEGEPREQAARRLAPLMAKAQALDPGALAGLGDVSPKILLLFDEARKR
jgi:hypothetical protein